MNLRNEVHPDGEVRRALVVVWSNLWICASSAQALQMESGAVVDEALKERQALRTCALMDFFLGCTEETEVIKRSDFHERDWRPGPIDSVNRLKAALKEMDHSLAPMSWWWTSPRSLHLDHQTLGLDILYVAKEWADHVDAEGSVDVSTFRMQVDQMITELSFVPHEVNGGNWK